MASSLPASAALISSEPWIGNGSSAGRSKWVGTDLSRGSRGTPLGYWFRSTANAPNRMPGGTSVGGFQPSSSGLPQSRNRRSASSWHLRRPSRRSAPCRRSSC